MRVKQPAPPVDAEPPRAGEDATDCVACHTPDESYIWVSECWRVRSLDRPTGLPAVLVLECRSHLDLGDLPNLLAAELGVMTVRLERAIRSLDGVGRVHVSRWGDGAAHLHMWFLARPYGHLQLRGTFLSLWDDILPAIPEPLWRDNIALVAAWLADFGGRAVAEPPHIAWQSPGTVGEQRRGDIPGPPNRPQDLADLEAASSTGSTDARPAATGATGSSDDDAATTGQSAATGEIEDARPGGGDPGTDDSGSAVTRDLLGSARRATPDAVGEAVTHDFSDSARRISPPRDVGDGPTVRVAPKPADGSPGRAEGAGPARPR
jgi:hypothetical protein